ncbi:YlcI/YnfO family protein [Paraburkholderia sp. J67]|uniref:YlcI/YnfO family protein n=1 Tax=Paraburkholderia sp. J67 TaxID=2805435 RepID=UPI002ABE10A3|nr:YlcI/YnfO family protein [Paraburkholderia sp. J67]
METVTLPQLLVDPELRRAAEEVLHENESLSDFMVSALREGIARRRLRREIDASKADSRARYDDAYIAAEDVHAELQSMLNAARKNACS